MKTLLIRLSLYGFIISITLITYSYYYSVKTPLSEYNLKNYLNRVRQDLVFYHDVDDVTAKEVNLKPPESHINNWRNLSEAEIGSLSVLGRRLFLNDNTGQVQTRNYTILFWKTGPVYENRHLYQYGTKKLDPLARCSVKNCEFKYDDNLTDTADAIVIHFHVTAGPHSFPNRTREDQLWIWYTDESPHHTFMIAKTRKLVDYNGYFNWSMSYKMNTDIPVAYGRTVPLTNEETAQYVPVDYFELKKKLVAVMGSNCGGTSRRWDYIKELAKYINIDAYGGCGTIQTCPGHFLVDCKDLNDYKFYLGFENSNCREYITEKTWWNALAKGAVPVVMGAPPEDYKKILPPNSFIHVNDFPSPSHLAKYIQYVGSDEEKYMSYHSWRSKFKVLNEHGFFATDVFHYCRICEALNYNDKSRKMYNNMDMFLNTTGQCYPPIWPKE